MAVAASKVTPRHWVYLDEARTHEVHAEVENAPSDTRLITTEFPTGSRDPAEAIQSIRKVAADAEVQRILTDLEQRLRLSGNYYRADAADMRWTPLGPPPANHQIDLRSISLPIPGAKPNAAKMSFHHFHATQGNDVLLISMPRLDVAPDKHALAELSFRFPRVDTGDLRLLHTRLTDTTLKSTLVRRHIELPRDGFAKLLEPKDYQQAYGDDWLNQTRGMFGHAANRMIQTNDGGPLLTKNGDTAPNSLANIVRALGSQRLAQLKHRYLHPDEERQTLEGGEHLIRRTIQTKRKSLPHTAAYDISILEAALLTQYAIREEVWSLLDEEGDKLLRYVHGYQ